MTTIVNIGIGNVGSMMNMLRKIGATNVVIAEKPQDIAAATRIILPGVGAFDSAMARLEESGLILHLRNKVLEEKVPILGVCLGMQLLLEKSEEGQLPGLGWIPGEVHRFVFPNEPNRKIPHMGWNTVRATRQSKLSSGLGTNPRFYFVHSYYVHCARPEDVTLEATYGVPFAAALQHENIYGVQFHPEKSHRFGMQILRNFLSA